MSDRPDIEYPCQWRFRIVGDTQEAIRVAVLAAVGAAEHDLAPARSSRTGRYVSMHLALRVRSEAHRDEVFGRLSGARAIKLVL